MEQKDATLGRGFHALNATQFLGALNDNLFKLAAIFFLIGQQGASAAGEVTALAGIIFVLPFLLFSPLAGLLADHVSKSRLIVWAKLLEVVVMTGGAVAFVLQSSLGLYGALFLMSLQSTLFSPAKYGIVPELVPRPSLSKANGQIEAFTYLAIILGTTAATLVPLVTGRHYGLTGLFCIGVAGVGLLASLLIKGERPAAVAASAGLKQEVRETWTVLHHDRYLLMALLGASLFMLVGAFVQLNLITYGIQALALSQEVSGLLFLFVALGIGAGSLAAGRLSGRNVELGVVPLGAILLAVAAILLGLFTPGLATVAILVALLGVGGGLFIVPLQAFIQFRAPDAHRGKVLAATNFLGWCGVLLAAVLTHVVSETLGLPAQAGFWGLGLFMLAMVGVTLYILPDFFIRFLALVLMRLVYRVRVQGSEHVPVEGGALLVANHVSWIDALLLLATQQRRIRFLMERSIYETAVMRHLFRLMGGIPIAATDGRRELLASLGAARQALDEGYLVCIFAEGALTRTGLLQEFRPGFERIVKGTQHPVIPVHLGGVWGSVFSYKYGPILSRLPQGLPEPVHVAFGAPLPATTGPAEVRQAVMQLSCDYFEQRKAGDRSLVRKFVRTARRNWFHRALSDATGRQLSFGQTLAASLLMRQALRDAGIKGERVGVLLPPSVAAAVVNLALPLAGKVPVNLNYTAATAGMRAAIAQAEIDTIITSQLVIERFAEIKECCRLQYVEELTGCVTRWQKLRALLAARFVPRGRLTAHAPQGADDLATIIFSSGSTSEPKGVMLTQHNVLSNIEALSMLFSFAQSDALCGVLPLFHSFGFTGTLWLPMVCGFSVVYHPSPLDAGRIVKSIRKNRSTFLLATPTFLSAYLRKAGPDDFASLRLVVAGAEKLSARLADEFKSTFGLTIYEGYGATELAPVAAINVPDVDLGQVRHAGTRQESVGQPLPGVAVRITDADSGAELPAGCPGMIHLRGPNVMLGYLNAPEKTAAVVKDGWYETGDIGCVDAQGFLKITGRLSRFSKIAGEMVPHGAIEDVLLQKLATTEPVVAVTAVADAKKGEKLVVLFKGTVTSAQVLRDIVASSELPNLWKPDASGYLEVDDIPLLGSGKLDLRGLKERAEALLA